MEQSSRYAARRAAGPQRLSALAHRAVALLLAASTLLPLGLQAEPVRRDHINVELVAAMDAAVPGEPLTVALRLEPDDHWHTYWRNPGDSGLPTRMSWTLPEGLQAGDILWPFPERQPLGPLTNFGYSGEHFLLTEIDHVDPPVRRQPRGTCRRATRRMCRADVRSAARSSGAIARRPSCISSPVTSTGANSRSNRRA